MCVCGTVLGVSVKRLRGGKTMVEVTLEEAMATALSPRLICRWFNVYHVQKMIAAGHDLIVFGKPKERAGKLYIDHPEFEIDEGVEESIHVNRITPIYRLTEGITQRIYRAAVYRALEELDMAKLHDRLPPDLDAMPYGARRSGKSISATNSEDGEAKRRASTSCSANSLPCSSSSARSGRKASRVPAAITAALACSWRNCTPACPFHSPARSSGRLRKFATISPRRAR